MDIMFPCAALLLAATTMIGYGVTVSMAQQTTPIDETRVDRLIDEMTFEEKLAMIAGTVEDPSTYQGESGYLAGVPRLGIPPLRMADGPPGILTKVPSAALTSTMGLAATFSREDALANGAVIGREARTHGIDVALQPFINIDRDITFVRGYNTFGEDPFLTGQMGAAEIAGIQQQGVMAQAKHFVGYDSNSFDVHIDEQALREVYAAPFAAAIDAGVSSIMCSYNKINGEYACGNKDVLTTILRDEENFTGFVTSDWGAVHAAGFINAGLDMEMSGPIPVPWADPEYFVHGGPVDPTAAARMEEPVLDPPSLPEEPQRTVYPWPHRPQPTTDLRSFLASGQVTMETVDRAVKRVLLQMKRFGYLDGKSKHDITPSEVEKNARIIRKTAEDAAVLLKNDGGKLPLTASDLESLAVIGPGGGQPVAVGLTGEKAVGLTSRQIGTVDALKTLLKDQARVSIRYAVADDLTGRTVPGSALSSETGPGLTRTSEVGPPQSEAAINFTHRAGTTLPADHSYTWEGLLDIPATGTYRIHLQMLGAHGSLSLDGKVAMKNTNMWLHGDVTQAGQDDIMPTTDGLDNLRKAIQLTAGKHRIAIELSPDTSHNPIEVRLAWVTPEEQAHDHAEAVAAARQAKTAVVFAWSRNWPTFGLPGDQDKLIAEVAAANPNTIVVLNTSQPVAMPWLPKVKSVLEMWWTGDEGGWATADVLLGRTNPAGRLPFTWPAKLQDEPASNPAYPERSGAGVDCKTIFSEGVQVGYRWFDRNKIGPLFPFGFGLSYSSFKYSGAKVRRSADGGLDVTFDVRNETATPGDEVAQVYLGKPEGQIQGAQFADRILAGFERVHLGSQETKQVDIHVPLRQLQYWDVKQRRWQTPLVKRTVSIGASSRDLRASVSNE